MALGVADIALVSPLGLSPSEHVFFARAEVSPHSSGAFIDKDGQALPIHDCPWIPASRPRASRIRLLAKQALGRAGVAAGKVPIYLIGPEAAIARDADLVRFLALSGHRIEKTFTGSAAHVAAFVAAEKALQDEGEIVVLAVDSLLSRQEIEAWYDVRYSGFTRNPLPPSEGAAAMRLLTTTRAPLAGKIHAFASAQSEATDDNDLMTDGVALTRVLGNLRLPAQVPLVVGPRDVDALRMRDFHLASVRHHQKLERAEMPSFEGRVGNFGSAGGLMSAVFAMAWLRHGLALPEGIDKQIAVAWARSRNGTVSAVLVGDEQS